MNNLTVSAVAVAEPQLRYSAAGKPVTTVRIVWNKRVWNEAKKTYEDGQATFMNAVAFGKLAENVAESVAKADRLVVTGEVNSRSWTNNEGEERTDFEMTMNDCALSLQFRPASEFGAVSGSPTGQQDDSGYRRVENSHHQEQMGRPF